MAISQTGEEYNFLTAMESRDSRATDTQEKERGMNKPTGMSAII
jgi:hypothetical protein